MARATIHPRGRAGQVCNRDAAPCGVHNGSHKRLDVGSSRFLKMKRIVEEEANFLRGAIRIKKDASREVSGAVVYGLQANRAKAIVSQAMNDGCHLWEKGVNISRPYLRQTGRGTNSTHTQDMNEAAQTVPCTTKEIKLSLADETRFWAKVDKTGGVDACWLWTASLDTYGYGQFRAGVKMLKAPRIAWTLANGQIPHDGSHHGTCVCHRCDNPACCKPSHLFLGTMGDNMRDKTTKGRCNSPFGSANGRHTKPHKTARGDRHGSQTKPESVARGERVNTAKLTAAQVIEIRERYAAGGTTQQELATQFGVKSPAISQIVNRRKWKHI